MYRVYVYRTNNMGQEMCYCVSRRYDSLEMAEAFAMTQNGKPYRKAEIKKLVR